jgi:HflK protein
VYFLVDFIREMFGIFRASAPFLMFGFLLAGCLRVLIPQAWLQRHLGNSNFRSVLIASLTGIPLPLCSCSVLPAAAALRKGGASKGATISFATSTPETGVDSISLTYALMDPIMTVARPVIAFFTALGAGVLVNLFGSKNTSPEVEEGKTTDCEITNCDCSHDSSDHGANRPRGPLKQIFSYAYGELLDDITPYFLGGLIVTGLIGALIPDGALQNPAFNGFPAMLVMLVVGIPLYVCATGSTPMAAMLIMKGLNPGAALVFLLAGPATNATSLAVLTRIVGRKAVVLYLVSITVFCLAGGLVLDLIYSRIAYEPRALAGTGSDLIPLWLQIPLTLVMAALLIRSAHKINLRKIWGDGLDKWSGRIGFNPGGKGAMAVCLILLIGLYLLTGCSVLKPGEIGWVISFGKVTRTVEQPGLVFHSPYPFAALETEARDQVRAIYRGVRSIETEPLVDNSATRFNPDFELTREAEVLTGDENIIVVQFSVHYSVTEPYAYHFGLKEAETTITAFAEYAVRRVFCEQETDSILVARHLLLQNRIAAELQSELDRIGAGMGVRKVDLLDVHAAPAVRYAFRDVASAMEDKHRYIRQAESYRYSVIASARGAAATMVADARSDQLMRLSIADGEASAFTALASATASTRELTKLRMQLSCTARVLDRVELVVPLVSLPLDIWLDVNDGKYQSWPSQWGGKSTPTNPTPAAPTPRPGWRDKLQDLQEKKK